MTSTINPQTALIYVMVTMAAVDASMSDKELRKIGNITAALPAFDEFSQEKLLPVAQECAAILQEEDGLATVLGLAKEALSPNMRETAYAMAADVAVADLKVGAEEQRLLEIIRNTLGVDRLVAVAIERGAQARHQTA
ncbi:tellurite resistance TerB family protein [Pyruvatibacter sp.]|uniref:tellurite resistance TerB family protein n=1 Tax=Pyruvatibacter sp. TaxID=1981328 RepID=UPI0032EB1E15